MINVDDLAKIIWDYHKMNQKFKKADCILVLGSHDIRVAEYAAKIYQKGFAPVMIFSGGIAHQDDLLNTEWQKSEAEIFADIAIKKGVPKEKIYIENKSQNTAQNIEFTRNLIREKGLKITSLLIIQKPYMERRTYATFKKIWPEMDFIVSSPQMTFKEYTSGKIPKSKIINIMVGDLQRIIEYGKRGYQIEQKVPKEVLNAYYKLIKLGYTKHLLKLENEKGTLYSVPRDG